MALVYHCTVCSAELNEPGMVIIGPPDPRNLALKTHLCVTCGRTLYKWLDNFRTCLRLPPVMPTGVGGYER